MTTLYAVGERYDRLTTVSGLTTSIDGFNWQNPASIISPFIPRQTSTGIATNGSILTATSSSGYISSSFDFGQTWTTGSIIDGDFSPMAIQYGTNSSGNNGIFMLVGSQKYRNDEQSHSAHDEVAQIFTSPNGFEDSWTMVYSQDSQNSILYGIRNINGIWISCGSADDLPLLLYSLDNGYSWDQIILPSQFNGVRLFDVTYTNNNFYISAFGVIIYTTNITTSSWNATNFVKPTQALPDFKQIQSNPDGQIVAVSSGMIYYSLDGATWQSHEEPGYQFTSVIWFNNHWVVGCRSLLTTYTYFISTDTITWTGYNNGMYMNAFTIN